MNVLQSFLTYFTFQVSLDLAWELLVEKHYSAFLQTLCATTSELRRFRELVVNSVMATDIMVKELKELRNNRWDKAFKVCTDEGTTTAVNRKATIGTSTTDAVFEVVSQLNGNKLTYAARHISIVDSSHRASNSSFGW